MAACPVFGSGATGDNHMAGSPLLWAQSHRCGLHSLGESLFSLVDPAEVGLLPSCWPWLTTTECFPQSMIQWVGIDCHLC